REAKEIDLNNYQMELTTAMEQTVSFAMGDDWRGMTGPIQSKPLTPATDPSSPAPAPAPLAQPSSASPPFPPQKQNLPQTGVFQNAQIETSQKQSSLQKYKYLYLIGSASLILLTGTLLYSLSGFFDSKTDELSLNKLTHNPQQQLRQTKNRISQIQEKIENLDKKIAQLNNTENNLKITENKKKNTKKKTKAKTKQKTGNRHRKYGNNSRKQIKKTKKTSSKSKTMKPKEDEKQPDNDKALKNKVISRYNYIRLKYNRFKNANGQILAQQWQNLRSFLVYKKGTPDYYKILNRKLNHFNSLMKKHEK
ncbi:MAG: hypothetical protein ACQES9_07285, partial [Myxococcota bacterium]